MKKSLSIILVICLGIISIKVISEYGVIKNKEYNVNNNVLIKDYWKDNNLKLTRKIENNEEGSAVWVPTDIMVKNDKLFIFNTSIPSGGVSIGLGFKDDFLYYKTPREIIGLNLVNKDLKKIFSGIIGQASFDENCNSFYIVDTLFENVTVMNNGEILSRLNMNDIFAKNNIKRMVGHRCFLKRNYIYVPSEFKYINSQEAYGGSEDYSEGIFIVDISTQKIKSIKSKGIEFGYYILGIDDKERIYTTTSYFVHRILVHDKHGNYLLEIKPNCTKYGKPVNSIYDELLVHPVYITEGGKVYIMIQTEEGTFIVSY